MDLGFVTLILFGILLNDVCGLSVPEGHQQEHRRRTYGLKHDIQPDPTTSPSPEHRPFKTDILSTNQHAESPKNHAVADQNIPTILYNNSSMDSATKHKHRRTSIKNSRRRQRRLRRKSRRRRKTSKKLRRSKNSKNRSRRRDRSGNTDKKSRRRNRSKRRKSKRRRKSRKTKRKSKNKVSKNETETSETQTNSTIRPETNSTVLDFKHSTLPSNTGNRTNSRTIAEILKQYRRLRSRRLSRLRQNNIKSPEAGTQESTDEHKMNINSLQRDSPNHVPRSYVTSRPYMLYRRPIKPREPGHIDPKSQIQNSRSLQMSRSVPSKSSLSDLMARFKKYVPSGSISQGSDGKYRIRYNYNRPSGGRRWSYRPSVPRYRPYYPVPRPTPRPLSRYVYTSYRGRRQYVPRAIHTFVYKYAPFIPLVYGRSRYVYIQPYNRPKPSQPILNNLRKCCSRYNTLCDEAMASLTPTKSPPGQASNTPVETPKPFTTPQPTTTPTPTTTSTPATTTTVTPTTTTATTTTTLVTTTTPTPKPTQPPRDPVTDKLVTENFVSFVYRYAVFIPLVYRRKRYVFIKPENRPVPPRTILRSLRRCCFAYRPVCDKAMANITSQEATSTRAPYTLPEQKANITDVTKIEEIRPNTFTGTPTRENESEPFTKPQNSPITTNPNFSPEESTVLPVKSTYSSVTTSILDDLATTSITTATAATPVTSSEEPATDSLVEPVTTAAETLATTALDESSEEPLTLSTLADSSTEPLIPTTLADSSAEHVTTTAVAVASSEEPMATSAESSVEPITTDTEQPRVTAAFNESSEEPDTLTTLTDSSKEPVSPTELPDSSEEPVTTVAVAVTSSEEPVKTSTLDDSVDELVVPTTLTGTESPSADSSGEPATTVAVDNASEQPVTLADSSGVSVTTAPLNGSSVELVTAPSVTTEALETITAHVTSPEQLVTSAASLNSSDTNKPVSTSQRPVFILPDDIDGSGEIEERLFIPRVSRQPDTGNKPSATAP